MSLDEKLKEILDNHDHIVFESTDNAMADIKQAFADEGYKQVNKHWQYVMTGQEWYNRLIEELPSSVVFPTQVIEAAKRAAGLTKEEA